MTAIIKECAKMEFVCVFLASEEILAKKRHVLMHVHIMVYAITENVNVKAVLKEKIVVYLSVLMNAPKMAHVKITNAFARMGLKDQTVLKRNVQMIVIQMVYVEMGYATAIMVFLESTVVFNYVRTNVHIKEAVVMENANV